MRRFCTYTIKVYNMKDRTKVNYADAVAESTKYFGGDELAATVWVSKYALKDSFGNIYESSPEQMHHRLAAELARPFVFCVIVKIFHF